MDNFDLRKYLAEGKLHEKMFNVATTKKIGQAVADAFTAEDKGLDLIYTLTPGTTENSFDLDVKRGPNTPDKDSLGQDIENYLGDYAGGSFYIDNGVVYNAAMRNAPVAKVSEEGEIEMISAADSRAAIGMKEVKETKSNKMKKSELKEMIRTAFLNEIQVEEAAGDDKVKELLFHAEAYKDGTIDRDDLLQAFEEVLMAEPVADIPGFEGTMDALDSLSIREEEEDVEVEDEMDVDVSSNEDGGIDIQQDAETEITGTEGEVQDSLEAALEQAKKLGDEKLVDQIGNTLTFFTRTHVVGK